MHDSRIVADKERTMCKTCGQMTKACRVDFCRYKSDQTTKFVCEVRLVRTPEENNLCAETIVQELSELCEACDGPPVGHFPGADVDGNPQLLPPQAALTESLQRVTAFGILHVHTCSEVSGLCANVPDNVQIPFGLMHGCRGIRGKEVIEEIARSAGEYPM
jgi:hypothetical protein